MKTSHPILALVLAGLLAGPIAACTSTPTRESTGEYVDDTVITTRVKGAIFNEPTPEIT